MDNPLPHGSWAGKLARTTPTASWAAFCGNADKTAGKAIADSTRPSFQGQQAGQQAQQAQGDRQGAAGAAPWRCCVWWRRPSPNAGMPANDRARAEDKLGIPGDTPATAPYAPTREDLLKQREDLAELNRQSKTA